MPLRLDALLAFGSLWITIVIALLIRVSFRRGRDAGDI
jgi:hypothetical protein